MNLFYLIVGIFFTFTFFRIAALMSSNYGFFQRISPLLHFGEFVAWSFIFWESISLLFSGKSYYSFLNGSLSIIFILLIVWFYIKDIIAGFIFRIRHNPMKGQVLRCAAIDGTIRSIGLSQLIIETSEGQKNRVPYSNLVTRIISIQSKRMIARGEISLLFDIHNIKDFNLFEGMVRETLAQSFWCIASKPISIQPDITEENKIKISFFLIDPSYLTLARESISLLINKIGQKRET